MMKEKQNPDFAVYLEANRNFYQKIIYRISGSTSTSVGVVAVAEYHRVSPQFDFRF